MIDWGTNLKVRALAHLDCLQTAASSKVQSSIAVDDQYVSIQGPKPYFSHSILLIVVLKAIEAAQVSAQVRPPKVRIVIESTNDPLMEGVLDQFLHQGDGLQIPNEGPSDNIGSNADDMPDDIVDLDDGLVNILQI